MAAVVVAQVPASYTRSAEFTITNRVINPNLQPFTATIVGFGNSLVDGGSFEPVIYRNRFTALTNDQDKIWLNRIEATHWDTLAEGALDGADVFVYRIENGRFKLARKDRVAAGGAAASGWVPAHADDKVVPADVSSFVFKWDAFNRPNVPYYFTVRAVGYHGKESADAAYVVFQRPTDTGKAELDNRLQPYRASRLPGLPLDVPAPQGLQGRVNPNGTLTLSWQLVDSSRVAGYRVYRSDYEPVKHKGFYLQLEGRTTNKDQAIRQGDMVIVSKKFTDSSRNRYHTNRVWGAGNETGLFQPRGVSLFPDEDNRLSWSLEPHSPPTPVEQPGETYLHVNAASIQPFRLSYFNHSGTEQSWYQVLRPEPYTVEVWLRRTKGMGSVRFSLAGYYSQTGQKVQPITFTPGSEWKKFTATFTPPKVQAGNRANDMVLEFLGPGEFDVDNFRVYRANVPFMDFDDADYAELKKSGMGYLRTHAFIKTGRKSYDLGQLTAPAGVTSSAERFNTLPQTLGAIRKAGMLPWLQIEPHFSPTEWLGLVEYLSAPYDPKTDSPQSKPWAYRRYAQGQVQPWTTEFQRWKFEIGNETWNGMFSPWVFNDMVDAATGQKYTRGAVYGLYQEYVIGLMRSSPYWQSAKLDKRFDFVLGGWNGFSYGREAAEVSPNSRFMTLAAYNGGWDTGEGPPALTPVSFFNVLNQVSQVALPSAQRHTSEMAAINQRMAPPISVGTYEAGPGYALNGLNNEKVTAKQASEQELVMKSLAAGTATIDTFLAQASAGYATQNFFIFRQGDTWSSHAPWYLGGHAYPSWQTLALFNQHSLGDMVQVKAVATPTTALQAMRRRPAVPDAALVSCYAIQQTKGRWAVWLVSRKVPDYPFEGDAGFTPVALNLPFGRARSITLHRLVGPAELENVSAANAKVETLQLPGSLVRAGRFTLADQAGGQRQGLPPASTLLLVFDGVSP